MDLAEFHPGPINQLPPEILEEILKFMPTLKLLGSSRLVCQSWHPVATFLCRQRHVKVKDHWVMCKSGVCLQDIFTRGRGIPWSAVDLELNHCPTSQKFCEDVCKDFGSSLQLIVFDVNTSQYNNFVRAIRRVSNLKKLVIYPNGCDFVTRFVFPSRGEVQLPKLEQLEIHYDSEFECQFVDVLEFILLNTEAPLKVLKVWNVYGMNKIQESERMAQVISDSNVKYISLDVDLCYESDQFPKWNILIDPLISRMNDLEIRIGLLRHGDTFHLLERCLAKCTGLRTLTFTNLNINGSGRTPNHQLPTLHGLENLKISLEEERPTVHANFDFPVVIFKCSNLRNLKSVYLNADRYYDPVKIDIRKLFDQFNCVKFLDIGIYHGEGKLSSIFPNLTKMKLIIEDSNNLNAIFDGMLNLSEVKLGLCSRSDNNVLLLQVVPFIQSLKKLKTLTVNNNLYFSNDEGELGGVGLTALASLHPLDLIIHNAAVKETDDCVALLRARHPQLRIFYI